MFKIHYFDNNKVENAEIICNNFSKTDVISFFQEISESVVCPIGNVSETAFKHYVLVVNSKHGEPTLFMYTTDFTFRRQLMENVHNSLGDCSKLFFAGFNDVVVAGQFSAKSIAELEQDNLNSFL
jgi:hypothetical protein